jgi:hypothetical protein
MNVLGVVSSYRVLHELMRRRADQLGLSRKMIDEIAGLKSGYSSAQCQRNGSGL